MGDDIERASEESSKLGAFPVRYAGLDVWRGVAALAVLIYHAGEVISHNRLYQTAPSGIYAFTKYGSLGVTLFFVISGYCIAAAAVSAGRPGGRGLNGFTWARLWRIFPTYWAALIFGLLTASVAMLAMRLGIIRQSMAGNTLTSGLLTWLTNLTLLHWPLGLPSIVPVSWTLSYEVSFYAVMVGVVLIGRRWHAQLGLTTCHLITASCCAAMLCGRHPVFPFDLWPQFGMGILIFDLLTRRLGILSWGIATASTLLVAAVAVTAGDELGPMNQPVRLTFGLALLFSAVLMICRAADQLLMRYRMFKCLQWIGVVSYSLYLTHFPILGLTNQLSRRVIPPHLHLLQLLLSVAAAIAFAAIFWRWIERPLTSREHTDHQKARLDQPNAEAIGETALASTSH